MTPSAQTSALLDDALAHFGLSGATVHDIRTGRVNKHWRVDAGDEAYVLRRYNEQRSPAAIRYEHDRLRHLSSKDWQVAAPIAIEGSSTIVEIDGRLYSLFPFLAGRPSPQAPRYARLKGRLLARLHQDLATWEGPGQREGFGRVWELDTYIAVQCDYATLNELLLAFGQQHPELARTIRAQKYAMLRELSTLGYGELQAVPCHFDFHHDNLLFQRGELSGLLDFDLAHLDARVADIASSISLDCLAPPAYDEINPALVAEFVGGYTEHAPLSDDELQLVVPLARAAMLWLVAWRLAQWARGDQPDDALRSLQRTVTSRFPAFARLRGELEAAVLQSQQITDDRQSMA
jgi:homoserine kinase type II